MISGTSAPRCAWCRARRGQSALGRAATAGRGPGAVRRAQVGGLLWPGLAGPAAQQPGRGGAQLDPGLGRRTDVAAAGQAERGYRAGPQGQCPRAGAGAGRVQALAGPARAGHRLCPGAAEWRPPRRGQDYLRGKIRQWGADEPSLYQMLAQSQERTGKPVQARRDMARYYTQIGAFAAAESQLQQARGCLPTSTSSRRSTCRSRKSRTNWRKSGSCLSVSNLARGPFRRSGPGAGAASSGAPERRRSGNRRGRRRRAGAAARWLSIPRAWAGRWPG